MNWRTWFHNQFIIKFLFISTNIGQSQMTEFFIWSGCEELHWRYWKQSILLACKSTAIKPFFGLTLRSKYIYIYIYIYICRDKKRVNENVSSFQLVSAMNLALAYPWKLKRYKFDARCLWDVVSRVPVTPGISVFH